MPFSFTNCTYLSTPPSKIICLVPSITELLFSLQLEQKVIGITKFCVEPPQWHKEKIKIGGTKNIQINKIKALQPDLIIANKEENVQQQIEELTAFTNVYVSDVQNVPTALQMIATIGQLTHTTKLAHSLIQHIEDSFSKLSAKTLPLKVAYLIWHNPYMTIGFDTFIHHMLQQLGLENAFEQHTRYPTISITDLQLAQCDCILLSTEPFPFQQKHIDELQQHLPNTKIILVDGQIFSWYGSRMLHFANYYNTVMLKQIQ